VPVWLVSLYVCGERYKSVSGIVGPADEETWRPIIRSLHDEMGLPHGRAVLSDWWIELFLLLRVTQIRDVASLKFGM